MVSKFLNIPYATVAYGSEINQWRKPSEIPFKYKISFKYASKIFCISAFTRKKLINLGINPNKLPIIHPAIDPTKFFPEQKASQKIKAELNLKNKKIILTLSRLVERKGIDKVIESMPIVLKEVPEAVYLIVGSGPFESHLKNMVKKHNLQKKIIFVGAVHDDDKINYYNACDVFIMPSRELEDGRVEGFGIVFLEANACNKPVIGSFSGGIPDAIANNKTGVLVDPLNVQEIASAIVNILKNPDYAKKLGLNGRKRVMSEFNWAVSSNKLLNEINKIMRTKSQ
jgi:phosphatidylinositol alpha-1,6-mannosyltransferase